MKQILIPAISVEIVFALMFFGGSLDLEKMHQWLQQLRP